MIPTSLRPWFLPAAADPLGDIFGVRRALLAIEPAPIVEMPYGLVHPALAPAIARLLGIAADEVVALGVPALYERLAAIATAPPELAALGVAPINLILGFVPVLSAVDPRPGAGGGTVAGPIDTAYERLIAGARHLAHLIELDAPDLIVDNARQRTQAAFERLLAACAGEPAVETAPAPADLFLTERPLEPALGWIRGRVISERPIACALLADGTLAIQGAFATACLRGRRVTAFASAGLRLRAGDAAGRRLLFDDDGASGRPLIWDRERERFVGPIRGFPDGWLWEELEIAYAVSGRDRVARRLPEVVDYPLVRVPSADTRWLWVEDKACNGGVFDTRTGVCEWPQPLEALDGVRPPVVRLGKIEGARSRRGQAVALGPDRRWRLYHDGVLFIGVRPAWSLAYPCTAAAFDRTGRTLALVGPDRAALIDVGGDGPPRLVREVDLAAVRAVLAWPPQGRQRQQLGWRYGTAAAFTRAERASARSRSAARPRRARRAPRPA